MEAVGTSEASVDFCLIYYTTQYPRGYLSSGVSPHPQSFAVDLFEYLFVSSCSFMWNYLLVPREYLQNKCHFCLQQAAFVPVSRNTFPWIINTRDEVSGCCQLALKARLVYLILQINSTVVIFIRNPHTVTVTSSYFVLFQNRFTDYNPHTQWPGIGNSCSRSKNFALDSQSYCIARVKHENVQKWTR